MQLTGRARAMVVTIVVLVGAVAAPAFADGELTMRGVYYKERATRVMQPMLDGTFDAGEGGTATAHMLVDAITSASVAAGSDGSPFTERRIEGGATYTKELGIYKLGGLVRYSTEPDYKSAFVGARFAAELFDRNLTLTLSANVGHDNMDNSGLGPMAPRREGELDTAIGSFGVAQILSPNLLASVTYDVSHLDGEQANLYRTVIAGGMQPNEVHPTTRTRHAVAGTVKWFVPRSATTVIGTARGYHDSWDLNAFTPEIRILQDVGDETTFGVRYRYHRQDNAYFYEPRYDSADHEFLSDDVKLSKFDSHTLGASLETAGSVIGFTGWLGTLRGQMVIEYVAQDNRFGNALVAHAALSVPFEY
jgi:hypothetical protein